MSGSATFTLTKFDTNNLNVSPELKKAADDLGDHIIETQEILRSGRIPDMETWDSRMTRIYGELRHGLEMESAMTESLSTSKINKIANTAADVAERKADKDGKTGADKDVTVLAAKYDCS